MGADPLLLQMSKLRLQRHLAGVPRLLGGRAGVLVWLPVRPTAPEQPARQAFGCPC